MTLHNGYIEIKHTTDGGLVLSEELIKNEGTVVAVSQPYTTSYGTGLTPAFKAGDRIVFDQAPLKIGERLYIHSSNVIAVYEK